MKRYKLLILVLPLMIILRNMKNTGISKTYQQVIPAEIFQFEIFGMINNLIKISKNTEISVFS